MTNRLLFTINCVRKYKEETYMLCSTHQPQCGSPELRHSPHVPYCSQDSIGTRVTCRTKKEQTEHIQSTQAALIHSMDIWYYSNIENHRFQSHFVLRLWWTRSRREKSEQSDTGTRWIPVFRKIILVKSKMMISTFIVIYSKGKMMRWHGKWENSLRHWGQFLPESRIIHPKMKIQSSFT